jgi:hypothetical protein
MAAAILRGQGIVRVSLFRRLQREANRLTICGKLTAAPVRVEPVLDIQQVMPFRGPQFGKPAARYCSASQFASSGTRSRPITVGMFTRCSSISRALVCQGS